METLKFFIEQFSSYSSLPRIYDLRVLSISFILTILSSIIFTKFIIKKKFFSPSSIIVVMMSLVFSFDFHTKRNYIDFLLIGIIPFIIYFLCNFLSKKFNFLYFLKDEDNNTETNDETENESDKDNKECNLKNGLNNPNEYIHKYTTHEISKLYGYEDYHATTEYTLPITYLNRITLEEKIEDIQLLTNIANMFGILPKKDEAIVYLLSQKNKIKKEGG